MILPSSSFCSLFIFSFSLIILLEIFCFYILWNKNGKLPFFFIHQLNFCLNILLSFSYLGIQKLSGYMQPKRFYNFNPSCHFFQLNMNRTRKKQSQPPPVSFSSLEVSFQSSAVVDSHSQRDAWTEFASSWLFCSTYWALDHQNRIKSNRIEFISLRWN